jgi:hypothetical protein
VYGIRRLVLFHGMRHPAGMGERETVWFLSSLAGERRVCASAQSQARAAVLFFYREVLGRKDAWLNGLTRARPPRAARQGRGPRVDRGDPFHSGRTGEGGHKFLLPWNMAA